MKIRVDLKMSCRQAMPTWLLPLVAADDWTVRVSAISLAV